MIDNKHFFRGYNYLYHFHIATILNHQYHNISDYRDNVLLQEYTAEQLSTFYSITENDYIKRSLIQEMRMTYLHSVETLFSFFEIFLNSSRLSFEDDQKINVLNELNLYSHHKLYGSIEKYADSRDSLNIIDEIAGDSHDNIGKRIFFFGMHPPEQEAQALLPIFKGCFEAIREALHLMAVDFGNRKEYNSYKHGLRDIEYIKNMYAINNETGEAFEFDTSQSTTHLEFDKKNNKIEAKTKSIDFGYAYWMTKLSARIINMMIYYRRLAYNSDLVPARGVPVSFLTPEDVKEHSKTRAFTELKPYDIGELQRKISESKFRMNVKSSIDKNED